MSTWSLEFWCNLFATNRNKRDFGPLPFGTSFNSKTSPLSSDRCEWVSVRIYQSHLKSWFRKKWAQPLESPCEFLTKQNSEQNRIALQAFVHFCCFSWFSLIMLILIGRGSEVYFIFIPSFRFIFPFFFALLLFISYYFCFLKICGWHILMKDQSEPHRGHNWNEKSLAQKFKLNTFGSPSKQRARTYTHRHTNKHIHIVYFSVNILCPSLRIYRKSTSSIFHRSSWFLLMKISPIEAWSCHGTIKMRQWISSTQSKIVAHVKHFLQRFF